MMLKLLMLWLLMRFGDAKYGTIGPLCQGYSYLNDNFENCTRTTTTLSTTTTTTTSTTTTTPLPTTSSSSSPLPSTLRTSSEASTSSTSPSTTTPDPTTSSTRTTSTSSSSTTTSPVVSSTSSTTEPSTTLTSTTGTVSLETSSSTSTPTGQPSSPSTVTTSTTTTTPDPATTGIPTTTSGETSTSTTDSTSSSDLPSSTFTTSSPAPSTSATLDSSSSSASTSTTASSSPTSSTAVTPSTSTAPLTSSMPSTPSSFSSSPTVLASSSTTSIVGRSPNTSTERSTSAPSGIETTTPSSSSTSPTTSPTPPSTATTTTSPGTTSTPAQESSSSTALEKTTSTMASTTTSTATTEAETTGTGSSSTNKTSTTEEDGSSSGPTTTGSTPTTGASSTLNQTSHTSTSMSSTVPSTTSSSSSPSSGAVETSTTERTSTLSSSSSPSTIGLEASSTATETSTVTVNTSTTRETSSSVFFSSSQLSSTSSTTSEALVSSSEPSTTGSTSFETSPREDSTVTVTETSTTASSTSFEETTASSGSSSADWETTRPVTTERKESTETEGISSTTPEAETTTVMEPSSTGSSTLSTTTETETSASERSSVVPTDLTVKRTPQPGPSTSSTSAEIPFSRLTDSTSTSTTTGTKSLETTTSETASSSPLTPDQGNGGRGGTIIPATTGSVTLERTSTENTMETSQKEVETTTPVVRSSEKTTATATATTTTERLFADGGRKITNASTASTSTSPGETKPVETSTTVPSTHPTSTLTPSATLPTSTSSSSTATIPTTTTETVDTTFSTVPTTETSPTTLKVTSEETTVGAGTSPSSSGVPTSPRKTTGVAETTTLPATTSTEGKTTSEKATVAAETTSSPTKTTGTTTTPTKATTEGKTTASTKQTTTEAEGSTSGKSQTTIQKLEVTSLPFSTMTDSPTTASKTETSQATATPPKTTAAPSSTTPLGTSTARTSTRRTTQPPKPTTPKPYGEGCPQRCPEGSLVGTGCCYTIVPLPFRKTWQGSFTYCQRNRTGHLIEEAEIMLDSGILKPWVASMGFQNASVYIGKVPFFQVGSRSYGQFANLSSITSFLVSPQTVIFLEEVYFTGICKIPQFCGTFNCSMEPLYDSLPGLLPLPMLEDVTPGANVSIQCNSPSITALKLKCDSFGKFFPRPGTPGASCKVSHRFNREKNTPGNKPLRPFCDCHSRGTASCVPVGDEFLCVCKPGWLKNTCWKSPDICWTPIGAPNKCLDRGTCFSWTDEFSCSCDYGFGGEICQIVLSNITWFGTPTTTPFLTPGRVMAISMLSVDFLEMFGRALLKYFPSNSRVPQDPLGFVHTWRKFSVGVAGFVGVFYAHPGWFDIGGDCCRMVYVCINGLMLFGHWMVFMESFVVFSVYFGLGRNRWSLAVEQTDPENWFQPQEAKKRWYLTKGFVFYIGAETCAFIQLFLLDRFYSHMIAPHSCIGQIISLENPITIVNLQIMGALACAASGLGILTQLVKLAYPELLAEQRGFYEFNKGRQGVELLDKVVRNNFQQMFQGPVLFAGYFLVIWSQDAVAFSSDQSLVGMAAIPVTICSVLLAACNLIAYSPWIYGHLMKIVLPRAPWLPIWTIYTPNSHGYLSHEEIVNRNEPNVTLPVNEDWPVRPEEDEYVSAERRHQCERRLTRNYLEMRLQGLTKDVCLEMIAERFLLAIPEGDMEGPQWLLILDRWLKTIERLDNIRWNIPRTQAETNDIYFARVMSATMFCEADILRENKDWARMEHLYYLMGHYPLEQNYLPRTWSQCRHVSQHKKLEEEWMVIRYGGDKTCRRRTKKNAAKLSPELFASPEAIQKYRKHAKEPHTELKEFPAARRYLLNDFYDKVFYGMEEGKRRWGVGMREGGVVEITDYMIDRAKDIQREDLRRRITPKTMNAYSRPEWTGEEDLIRMSVPKASVLIGMNGKLKEVVAIPPVILDRMGVPSSLYRW